MTDSSKPPVDPHLWDASSLKPMQDAINRDIKALAAIVATPYDAPPVDSAIVDAFPCVTGCQYASLGGLPDQASCADDIGCREIAWGEYRQRYICGVEPEVPLHDRQIPAEGTE